MHSFPTRASRQRYGREAPAGGEGGGAWGMPCPRRQTLPDLGLRTCEHRAHHHPHEQSFPSGDGQHDRSTGRPRPQRSSANDDRTSARRPEARRRGRRSRPHDEPFSPTKRVHARGSRNMHPRPASKRRKNSAGKRCTTQLPSPAGGFERSPLPAGGGYVEGSPTAT